MSDARESLGRRYFLFLLRLLPADYRAHRGPDLMADFDAMRTELGRHPGAFRLLRFYLGLSFDLLRRIRHERARSVRNGWEGRSIRGPGLFLDRIVTDIRLSLRSLSRRPLFVGVATLSLAIGVGANTAIFTVVDAALLRPPSGVHDGDRLVELSRVEEGHGLEGFSYLDYLDVRREATPFSDVAAWTLQPLSLTQGGEGVQVLSFLVSSDYFQGLRAGRPLGRYFVSEEDEGPDQHFVVVLSDRLWRERFSGDPEVIGRTVELNRHTFTVVGVAPPDFNGHLIVYEPDVYIPLMQFPVLNRGIDRFESRGSGWLFLLGRLRDGSTMEQAQASLNTIFQRLAQEYPDSHGELSAQVDRYAAVPALFRTPVTGFLGALSALVLLVLLITASNLAGVTLARAQEREQEIAVRLSLGSGRLALARQLLVEVLIVFLLGGALGILLATWLLGLIPFIDLPAPIPLHIDLTPDARVMAFGLGLTLLTGIAFGLLPSVQATRVALSSVLKGDPSGRGRGAGWIRRSLVSAQVGLSLVLVLSSGLFLRSLQRAGGIETGFDPEGVYLTQVDLTMEGYTEDEGQALHREILDGLPQLSWVESVSISADLPMDLGQSRTVFYSEEWQWRGNQGIVGAHYDVVSPDYFSTLGISLRAGRFFRDADATEGQRVCIVSETFAREMWPGEDALGRSFHLYDADGPIVLVVGVVADVKPALITDEPTPIVYIPLAQMYQRTFYVAVRTTAGTGAALAAPGLRRAVLDLDPQLTLQLVGDMVAYTGAGILPQRAAAWITTPLALLALILSGIGIYGVVAHAVVLRTKEIGIRMALGAEGRWVLRQVLMGAVRLTLPGLIVGGAAAVGVGVVLRSFLLGLGPWDPAAFGVVVAAIAGVVLMATFIPARRAVGVDPAQILRGE
ncbi:ABC transporter permease [Gemmatimonadota bacterium]